MIEMENRRGAIESRLFIMKDTISSLYGTKLELEIVMKKMRANNTLSELQYIPLQIMKLYQKRVAQLDVIHMKETRVGTLTSLACLILLVKKIRTLAYDKGSCPAKR